MNIIENFAKYEMRCAMTDGLFRPLKRGPRPKAEVTNSFGAIKITFKMYDALGADDETVLLAILSLMRLKGEKLEVESVEEEKTKLRMALSPKGDAKDANSGCLKTSIYEIAKRAGYGDSGKANKIVRACLERLSLTTLILDDKEWHGSMTLLGYLTNKSDGRIEIACHWRLAEAIFGNAQFAKINLEERHKIDGDVGRILHRWLSGWVQCGKEASIRMAKLEGHVWPQDVSDEHEARKERIEKLKHSLAQIGQLRGWSISIDGRGWDAIVNVSRISRPEIS